MLEAIGVAAIAITTACITFYAALRIMDSLECWRDAGLAAFIPMFAVAIPTAIAAAGFAVWLIK